MDGLIVMRSVMLAKHVAEAVSLLSGGRRHGRGITLLHREENVRVEEAA